MQVAVASLFDAKVGKQTSESLDKAIKTLDLQQLDVYGLNETPVEYERTGARQQQRPDENEKDASGLTKKQVKVFQDAAKIDMLMAKMTGRPTGAAWSVVTDGNLNMGADALNSAADRLTGDAIVGRMQMMHSRMRSSVGAGPRGGRGKGNGANSRNRRG